MDSRKKAEEAKEKNETGLYYGLGSNRSGLYYKATPNLEINEKGVNYQFAKTEAGPFHITFGTQGVNIDYWGMKLT